MFKVTETEHFVAGLEPVSTTSLLESSGPGSGFDLDLTAVVLITTLT